MTGYCLIAALLFLFPIVQFPLTDGDVRNWGEVVTNVLATGSFAQASDQAHGPLLVLSTVFFAQFVPVSFVLFNLFNAFMAVMGLICMRVAAREVMGSKALAEMASFMYVTTLVVVYLSRTPMYDWPVAICVFCFATAYMIYVKEKKLKWFILALFFIAIGSLGRFSISIVASMLFMGGIQVLWLRQWRAWAFQIASVLAVIILVNVPWMIGQVGVEGTVFLKEFFIDNVVRYARSNRPNDTYRFDFYALPISVVLGLIPYAPVLLLKIVSKSWWKKMLSERETGWLLVGSIPILVLFSASGHTKILRYVSYVFPFLILAMSYVLYQDLEKKELKRLKQIFIGFFVVVVLVLIQQAIQFMTESLESPLFVFSLASALLALLSLGYWIVLYKLEHFQKRPSVFLAPFVIVYLLLISVVTYEATHAYFIHKVQKDMAGFMKRIPLDN